MDIVSGKRVGIHEGVWFYTVGQRKGLGMAGGPWYVVKKDLDSNTLYVAHAAAYEDHGRRTFTVAAVHWVSGEPASSELQTKLRHTPRLENCTIRSLGQERVEVTLESKDQGVAPGQSAIFYQGEICLGGGVIEG